MNRIMGRAKVMLALVLVLALGISFFLGEYIVKGESWVLKTESPHVYDPGGIGCGVLTDRNGILLLDMKENRTYASDTTLRSSVIHWFGDRRGNIYAPVMNAYSKELAGYDPINGVYAYGGIGGVGTTTFSAQVQMAAQEAMEGAVGTLAIMNYQTGEIICAITTPNFDPDNEPDIAGDTTGAYEGVYVNRFTQSTYTPGSIYKIMTAAAALETIPDIMEQSFTCTGIVEYGVDKVTCQRKHGKQSFADAFANSCNCAFASIANQVGGERLESYAKQFGILDSVQFDGITTAAGSMDSADAAPVLVAWSGIGQHLDLINPCSYLAFVGAIANDGVLVKPYVVSDIKTSGKVTYQAQTQEVGRIMSAETAQTLQSMLKNNVTVKYGEEKFPDLVIGAKTGTAQVGEGKLPNATFAGFVDDEALPLAFIAIIEDGETGGKTCIPKITQALEACIKHLK